MNKAFEFALSQFGISETSGLVHNPEVLKYFKEIGHKWVETDETAWCSAFVNWCCKKAKLPYSGALNARSWLKIGRRVKEPKIGDIVVLWREKRNSWKGHVGFFVRETENHIYILGGNQSNMVRVTQYPKNRLLQYRRL